MRELLAVLLLVLATPAWAFRGRPVSDLRFDGREDVWQTKAASDGFNFLLLAAAGNIGSEHTYTQKIADGRGLAPQRLIGRGAPVDLVWTGNHYLAGWAHAKKLWVAPVSREGSPLSMPAQPAVEGDFVLFAANRNAALAIGYTEQQLTVQPLDVHGERRGDAVVHAAPVARANVTAAAAAEGFALVFSGWNGTWLMLFRADGSAIASAPVVLDGPYGGTTTDHHSNRAAIATDGTDTLVVFGAGRYEHDAELKAAVIGANGAVGPTRVVHAEQGYGADGLTPAGLVWDGTQYLAAVNVLAEVNPFRRYPAVLRIGRDGQKLGEPAIVDPPAGNQHAYSLASNGRELVVPLTNRSAIVNAATLQPGTPVQLGRTIAAQHDLALAAGPGGYLAAWFERAGAVSSFRASRIDAAGNHRDGDGIELATLPTEFGFPSTHVAIDGHGPQWLVAWASGWNVSARFVSRDGVAGPAPIAIGRGGEVAVRWDGSQYVVLFSDFGTLRRTTISPAGVVGEIVTVAETEHVQEGTGSGAIHYREPRLVLLQNRLFALYTKERSMCWMGTPGGCSTQITVTGRRLDADDAAPFTVADHTWGRIAVAEGPAEALVLWGQYQGLRGAFLSPEGQAGAPFAVDANGLPSSAAFDGSGFIAAWGRSVARIGSGGGVSERQDLRLERDEQVLDPVVAASATLAPLVVLQQRHAAYDVVARGALLFASEFDDQPAPPPPPSIVCATRNDDGTIAVRWQPMPHVLGFAIELRLEDGTFRQVAVAPGGAAAARVALPGLEGDAVRVRAWNAGGLSAPSSLAPGLPPPTATLRPSMRACAGTPATITITLAGAPPFTVRWADGETQSNLATSSATRTVTVTRDTTFTIVAVEDASCAANTTPESIRVTVDPQPAIRELTRDARVSAGQTATLTVTASDATRYAWFEGSRGDTSKPVGSNSASFTTPALARSARYWVRVSNRCGSADSQTIDVIVSGKRRSTRR